MAPAVTLEARAVLDDDGRATAWETAQHMMDFADSGVDILNLSLGCRTTDGLPPLLMSRAVGLLSQRMVIVAAGGNNGAAEQPALRNAPIWPAALPDVVAVGARDIGALGIGEGLAKFSPQLPWVTCTAPGVNLTGAFLKATVLMKTGQSLPFDGYATWSGTSFATAMVSGAIAAATVPGKVTAHEALHGLLSESGGVVRPYVK
jgi:subtilisin family serine protease